MTSSAPGSIPSSGAIAPDDATGPAGATAYPSPRTRSRLGLAAVIVAAVGLLPAAVLMLIALIPDMAVVLWFGIVVLPFVAVFGLAALIMGLIALFTARAGVSKTLPIVGTLLGAFALLAPLSLLLGWWS
ncbi:hypothetical protein ACWPKO_25595 (plasmid) [Coraliomargarita sp. W4R53]